MTGPPRIDIVPSMSEQPVSTAPVSWPLRQLGRLFLSAAAGVAVGLAATALPSKTRIVFGLDMSLVAFVALTYVLMSVTTADECVAMANQKQRIRHTEVIASIVITL